MTESFEQPDRTLVPVFPLPSCVLFPGVVIPLHIFEPRYRMMIDGLIAEDNDKRYLALALLKQDHVEQYGTKTAPIHDIVCVGRLIDYEKLDDGRYNLMLMGCARARIDTENHRRPYRRARLIPVTMQDDLPDHNTIETLDVVRSLIDALGNGSSTARKVFDEMLDGGADLPTVVDLLTYHLMPPEDSGLKYRVLEEPALSVRTRILLRWLRSRITEAKHRTGADRLDGPDPSLN